MKNTQMSIVQVPHTALANPVRPVAHIDKKIHRIVEDMTTVLEAEKDPEGVGLAANQVGLPLALFIMKPDHDSPVTVCINPKILKVVEIKKSTDTSAAKKSGGKKSTRKARLEGCLSIPRVWGRVTRAPKVQLSYSDLDGKPHTVWFSGFESIIVQHEMDHLNGVLFTQRVIEQKQSLYKEDNNGELEPYEI